MQASADTVHDDFRDTFPTWGGGETVRAVVLFGVLLTILVAIVGHLLFQEVSLNALEERLVPFVNLGQAVYIQGDTAINYGRIMEVVDAVKGAGLNTVNLVTTPVPVGSR